MEMKFVSEFAKRQCDREVGGLGSDSQRNMRSVCWRPLIASSTAAWAVSSWESASLRERERFERRRLNFAVHDAVRMLLRRV
jgi:hypothetical protein